MFIVYRYYIHICVYIYIYTQPCMPNRAARARAQAEQRHHLRSRPGRAGAAAVAADLGAPRSS